MISSFDERFERDVEPHLTQPDGIAGAVEALEEMMPAMATREDRSQVYQWLGTLHQSLAARALSAGDRAASEEHFQLSEEFFLKGIEEAPARMPVRLALARYYLSFGADPGAALETLTIEDRPAAAELEGRELAWEHQRLALIAVTRAMEGDLDRCGLQLEQAFSEDILSRMDEGVELASLEYLASQGVPFTEASVGDIIARLQRCGFNNPQRLDILRQRLLMGRK